MPYREQSLDQLLADIASKNVTPAGGSGAAVVGAIGASLCEMVCIHTIRRDSDRSHPLLNTREELERQRNHLLALADADAEAVDEFLRSRHEDNQTYIKRATGIPLTIAKACVNVLNRGVLVAERGNENAFADVFTGILFVQAAFRATAYTVRNNLEHISDPAFTTKMEQRLNALEREVDTAFTQVSPK